MLGNKEIMAKNISKQMKIKNVDRKKMAEDLDVKYTTLSDWINAKTYPRIDKIEAMANYFDINKSDLVEEPSKVAVSSRAEVIAAHIDDDATEEEIEEILAYIEMRKSLRNKHK